MKKFIATAMATFCLTSYAGGITPDGDWWRQSTEGNKLGYVVGYLDSLASAGYSMPAAVCIELHQRNVLDKEACVPVAFYASQAEANKFGQVTFGTLMEGLDKFYSDYANRLIRIPGAINYVHAAMSGKSAAELANMVEAMRRASARSTK